MVKKKLGCKWYGFQMGSEIWKPNHLKSRQTDAILSKTFEIRTKMSGYQMVGFQIPLYLDPWLESAVQIPNVTDQIWCVVPNVLPVVNDADHVITAREEGTETIDEHDFKQLLTQKRCDLTFKITFNEEDATRDFK